MKNETRYPTLGERIDAFRQWCKKPHCADCALGPKDPFVCILMWLQSSVANDIRFKPCPFCGCDQVKLNSAWKKYKVYCAHCGCQTPVFNNPKSAIESWNYRPGEMMPHNPEDMGGDHA